MHDEANDIGIGFCMNSFTLRYSCMLLFKVTSLFPSKLMYFYLFVSFIMVAAILKRPRTPPTNNPAMDYQTADSEHVLKRSRPFGISDEVPCICINLNLPRKYPSPATKI